VIAAAVDAKTCEIYTDVDGVYTTDPRKVPEAKKIETISHDEMLEMASLGAGVMHPRAVETAKVNNMAIDVKHSHKDVPGTKITSKDFGEKESPVSGLAADTNVAKVGIMYIPDLPGTAAKLFDTLSREKINVDVIVQSIHEVEKTNDISYTVAEEDFKKALEITSELSKEWQGSQVAGDANVAKVSIVGIGMTSSPGVAAKMFQALGKESINIQMISTSEIKISCIIDKDSTEKAVKAIHDEFDLHE
jgi:aspartate kinase